ncbi:redoxin domain-containing protein [Yunchengibacter salinarum]|uniref:redoxin domain-containing protein n=1 Tax=Yunchengibacter salinarum TaxID=3133399 RepID=UPI0035B67574
MTPVKHILLSLAALLLGAHTATASPVVGEPAPDFTLKSASGGEISLEQYAGKPVILEWTNHQCPYVGKHYGSGNMQRIQKKLTDDGAVWLSIISSAPGKQGHVEAEKAVHLTESRGAYPTHVLLDPKGDVGRLYGARTTPHMFLIDADGTLKYKGAIDDRSSPSQDSLEGATNYVTAAWSALQNGEEISPRATRPYGCSVKY